ncbi:hypothetical protein [Georgenia muralis]|uniref:DUF4913 domain-containing protein n=1 Tax=Georgenia muralis TaxID=154117 RepID=A0A3N4Z9N5_9MICO|nr:hypothetical protein [Georgenia muralis]RPF28616.1 hypothetical protein EDD32_3150 [Georgenia muralis]
MDGQVPWQFDTDPADPFDDFLSNRQFVEYEAELAADLNDAVDAVGEVEPVDWRTLTAVEAEMHWRSLDTFVHWLRTTYGLPPTVIPPLWHRHPELVWELSALHTHWMACYEPGGSGSGPIAWHADFADTRDRLREWVATSGTRLDRDRPTRATSWPGEPTVAPADEQPITDRRADFAAFVAADLDARRATRAQANRKDWAARGRRGAS